MWGGGRVLWGRCEVLSVASARQHMRFTHTRQQLLPDGSPVDLSSCGLRVCDACGDVAPMASFGAHVAACPQYRTRRVPAASSCPPCAVAASPPAGGGAPPVAVAASLSFATRAGLSIASTAPTRLPSPPTFASVSSLCLPLAPSPRLDTISLPISRALSEAVCLRTLPPPPHGRLRALPRSRACSLALRPGAGSPSTCACTGGVPGVRTRPRRPRRRLRRARRRRPRVACTGGTPGVRPRPHRCRRCRPRRRLPRVARCPCLLPPPPLCKAPPCALPLSPCATGSRVSLLLLSLVSERDMLGRGRSLSCGVLN